MKFLPLGGHLFSCKQTDQWFSKAFNKFCGVLNLQDMYPVGIYLLKINNKNTRTRCEICSKLTITISERRHWRRNSFGTLRRFH